MGAIPNGRDKRDETGIDSDAMVSVSGIKQDFVEMYVDEAIANGMQLHGLGGKMCRPPKKGLMMKKVVGYEELDIDRETPIDTFIYDVEGVYMPNAEVNVFSELRLAETGLHVYPDIQNGKLVGKYLKHVDTPPGKRLGRSCCLTSPMCLNRQFFPCQHLPSFQKRHSLSLSLSPPAGRLVPLPCDASFCLR